MTRGRLGRAVPREHADRADTGLGSPHLGLDPETAGEPRRCYHAKAMNMAPDDRGTLPTLMLTDLLLPDPRPTMPGKCWGLLHWCTCSRFSIAGLNPRSEKRLWESVGCLGAFWCQELGWQALVWLGGSIDTDMR